MDWFIVDTAIRFSAPLGIEWCAFQYPQLEVLLGYSAKLRSLDFIQSIRQAQEAQAICYAACTAAENLDRRLGRGQRRVCVDAACAAAIAVAVGPIHSAATTAICATTGAFADVVSYSAITAADAVSAFFNITSVGAATAADYTSRASTAADIWHSVDRLKSTQSAKLIHWLDLDVHTVDEASIILDACSRKRRLRYNYLFDPPPLPDLSMLQHLQELQSILARGDFVPPTGLDNKWKKPVWDGIHVPRWTTIYAWDPNTTIEFVRLLVGSV